MSRQTLVLALFCIAIFASFVVGRTASDDQQQQLPQTISPDTDDAPHVDPTHGFGSGRQDWSHVTVREGVHMFYWLFYGQQSTTPDRDAAIPLVIWLQGGPGGSSTGHGNFFELGPLDLDLNARNHTWLRRAHVLFVDMPAGAGFSWLEKGARFARTDRECAEDFVRLMLGFYANIPHMRSVPVHLFGQSYGGKLAIEVALEWTQNEALPQELRSVNSINGWIAPIRSVRSWAPFLLHTGYVNRKGFASIEKAAERTQNRTDADQWLQATIEWGRTEQVVLLETGGIDFYNILEAQYVPSAERKARLDNEHDAILDQIYAMLVHRRGQIGPGKADAADDEMRPKSAQSDDERLASLMNGPVRRALNVSVEWGAQSSQCFSAMTTTFMRPAVSTVRKLLETSAVRVNIISGQLDLICATPGTVDWLHELDDGFALGNRWAYASESRRVEGYRQRSGALSYYSVMRAGHQVPLDNPDAMEEILRRIFETDVETTERSV